MIAHITGKTGLVLILSVVLGLSGCTTGSVHNEQYLPISSPQGQTTTYVMVRHAEKDSEKEGGPLLKAGHERARLLADILEPMKVTAIYCPDLIRNVDTAKPLAKRLNLKINKYSTTKVMNKPRLAADFVTESMEKHSGGVILWVGNNSLFGRSNLQEIYTQLGGEGQGPRAYHDLYILTIDDKGNTEVQKNRYGKVIP